jgi:hypothetical protein
MQNGEGDEMKKTLDVVREGLKASQTELPYDTHLQEMAHVFIKDAIAALDKIEIIKNHNDLIKSEHMDLRYSRALQDAGFTIVRMKK